jgi:hypothetical protein
MDYKRCYLLQGIVYDISVPQEPCRMESGHCSLAHIQEKHHETFYVPEEEFPNENKDGDELLHDDEWALKDEEEPVHINEPPGDINNHYDGGNDHRFKQAKTGGSTIFMV